MASLADIASLTFVVPLQAALSEEWQQGQTVVINNIKL